MRSFALYTLIGDRMRNYLVHPLNEKYRTAVKIPRSCGESSKEKPFGGYNLYTPLAIHTCS